MPFEPPPDDVPLQATNYSGIAYFSDVSGAQSVSFQFSLAWMTNETSDGLDELFQNIVDALSALPNVAQLQAAKSVTAGYGQNCTPTPPPEESAQ